MLQPDFLVNYRTGISKISEKNVINSKAWIQTAVNFSKNIETAPYNESLLKPYLSELRSMTVQKPEVFLPRLRKIFAECGVAFVLLPHLKNSGVNGAVKWINDKRRFAPTKYTSDDEILAFAKEIGIHPGIVAGRLQHDKIIPPNRCSKLKEKYVIGLQNID